MVERGTIVSPRLTNILPGISREMVVELAGELGIPLAERDFEAGTHSLTWDGLDDRGSSVASGVYLLSMESPEETDTAKLVLLR